ncbi:DUF2155 domain-containing protein [Methylocystis sp. ATCC 49242]|uniref:DUF2155 domain-containing protein n=1 Tax=Methylocystis sp. ATCC 49242 TaxID=622637 RepID=UPI0001F87816|nr:DUF2155 domain-containing protein [Methylocystis sp. ATCC 49242]
MIKSFRFGAALGVAGFALSGVAVAEPIRHPTATFAGLDKTTGRIINFDVAIDETVQFGALQVTPRVCNTRPQTETPQTTSFVEVDELILKPERQGRPEAKPEQAKTDGKQEAKRIFSGWMFAASPGLHGVEHPVYDVWLVDCKGGKESAPAPAAAAAEPSAAPDAAAPAAETGKKRRSRKVEPAAPAPVENQPIGPADQPPAAADSAVPAPEAVPGEAPAEPAPPPARKKKRKKPAADAPAAAPVEPTGGNPLLPF